MAIEVDLSSDTVTKPTQDMRRFMCEAEVGDEQKYEDPTVNLLQDMVAELLGKEAALFLPSGTMCNEIALRVHCRHGEEMLAHASAHPIHFESGGPAALAGVNVRSLDGPRGQYDAATLEAAIRPDNRHMPRSRLVWVEQTSNLGGGSIWPLAKVREVAAGARRRGLSTHMDGARLMNAVVASGVPAQEWAAPFDSAWIDFTKGLGAPVGAAIAGSRDFIAEAWRLKQQMGGAMRQAGIIAAGGIYALRHHVKRLAEDHANARRLADGLAALPGISLDPATVETNLVFFDVTGAIDAPKAVAGLLARGIRMGALGPRTIRAVTHLDVSAADVDKTLAAARKIFPGLSRISRILFDHIAIGVPAMSQAAPFLAGELGGVPDVGSPSGVFRWGTYAYEGGGSIEVLEPLGPSGFLHRFLAERGSGIHHVTFKVPSLDEACTRAEAAGYDVIGRDTSDPEWREAFLYPKQALGIVVQLAQPGSSEGAPSPSTPPPAVAAPPPPVTVLGIRMRCQSRERAITQWSGVLQGQVAEGPRGGLVFRWPGSPMRVAVNIDPVQNEGPIAIELKSARRLGLPAGPHPVLGAVFTEEA